MTAAARSVIFDYDDTLVDTVGAFLKSINTALGNAGLESATMREMSSMDLRSIIEDRVRQAKSPSSPEPVFNSIWEVFAGTLASPFPLREGAAETLTELSRRGIGLALISKRGGRAGSLPLNELRSTGLDALFRFVRVGVGLREYGIVVNEALEVLSAEAQETVLVSDWCKDIEYAKFSGLTAIGIVGGVSEADEHRNAGADWVIEYLSEIPTVL